MLHIYVFKEREFEGASDADVADPNNK